MVDRKLFAIILFSSISGILAGEYCIDYSSDLFDSSVETIYCEDGCCGDTFDQHCCLSSEAAKVVGIVIGAIAGVAGIVTVLVIIFCCCRKSRGRAGQVCQPNQGVQATTTVQMQGGMAGYGYGYNGNYPVTTSNMAPGSVQQWQQPPPDTMYPKQ